MEIAAKQTVLIMDDDQSETLITKRVLSKIAPDVVINAVHSGEEGLALLRSGKPLPRLILLDIKMVGMSGLDVLRRIRADGRLKHLPVIIVTNSTLESDRLKSLETGADDFLHKAFDIGQFQLDIESLLQRYLR